MKTMNRTQQKLNTAATGLAAWLRERWLRRRRRAVVEALRDASLEREIASGHPDRNRRATARAEIQRTEVVLMRRAVELNCARAALAALHPASRAARIVAAEWADTTARPAPVYPREVMHV